MSEEVRSRCHVKHTIPRWPTESSNEQQNDTASGTQNVRRQKSWDMLDQSAITYARQQQHKVPHQVNISRRDEHTFWCKSFFLHTYLEFEFIIFFSLSKH